MSKHGPSRHYYLMRNGVYLLKLGHISRSWKAADAVQLANMFIFVAVAARPRGAHIRAMLRGLWHGVTGSAEVRQPPP